jgi:hypothetical protein
MQMYEISIVTNEAGDLMLQQGDVCGEGSTIILSAEQVPIVCEWMMQAIGAKTETRDADRA